MKRVAITLAATLGTWAAAAAAHAADNPMAPLAFLANGLSYLWSAAFESIMRLPAGPAPPRRSAS